MKLRVCQLSGIKVSWLKMTNLQLSAAFIVPKDSPGHFVQFALDVVLLRIAYQKAVVCTRIGYLKKELCGVVAGGSCEIPFQRNGFCFSVDMSFVVISFKGRSPVVFSYRFGARWPLLRNLGRGASSSSWFHIDEGFRFDQVQRRDLFTGNSEDLAIARETSGCDPIVCHSVCEGDRKTVRFVGGILCELLQTQNERWGCQHAWHYHAQNRKFNLYASLINARNGERCIASKVIFGARYLLDAFQQNGKTLSRNVFICFKRQGEVIDLMVGGHVHRHLTAARKKQAT